MAALGAGIVTSVLKRVETSLTGTYIISDRRIMLALRRLDAIRALQSVKFCPLSVVLMSAVPNGDPHVVGARKGRQVVHLEDDHLQLDVSFKP